MKRALLAVAISLLLCNVASPQNYTIQQYLNIKSAGSPSFSPDGKHFAFAALRAAKWRIVIDGAVSPEYDEIVSYAQGERIGRDSLVVLARRGAEDVRVSIAWERR